MTNNFKLDDHIEKAIDDIDAGFFVGDRFHDVKWLKRMEHFIQR